MRRFHSIFLNEEGQCIFKPETSTVFFNRRNLLYCSLGEDYCVFQSEIFTLLFNQRSLLYFLVGACYIAFEQYTSPVFLSRKRLLYFSLGDGCLFFSRSRLHIFSVGLGNCMFQQQKALVSFLLQTGSQPNLQDAASPAIQPIARCLYIYIYIFPNRIDS